MTRILVINGHPDPSPGRFAAALADAYARGAEAAGHTVSRLAVGEVPAAFMTTLEEFGTAPEEEAMVKAQALVREAGHVVIIYPLWLGTMPARLKAFFEQLARGGFFLSFSDEGGWPGKNMRGKSARVVVTMGMPAFAYRLFFGAHSLKALESGILGIAGFRPVRDTIFGGVESGPEARARMLRKVEALGRKGL